MKKLITIAILLICCLANAQTKKRATAKKPAVPVKPTELYDLLTNLAPEKSAASWDYLKTAPINVAWKSAAPLKSNVSFTRTGSLMPTMNGQKFVHNDKYSKATLTITGDDKKFKSLTWEVTTDMYADILENLKAYFKGRKVNLVKVKESFQGFYNYGAYECKIAGMNSLWIAMSEMTNKDEINGNFLMEVYFEKKDLETAIKNSGI